MTSVGERVRARLPRGGFFRGAATIVAGTGAAQVVTLVTAPIVTRLYSPADFGVFAAALALLNILITISCLSYDLAIPLPESDDAAANVLAVALLSTAATTVGTVLVIWLTGGSFLILIGAASLAPYVLLLALGQFVGGSVAAMIAWAVRTRAYSEIAANRLAQSLVQAGGQVGLGLLGAGPAGLFIGTLAAGLAGSSRLARRAWRGNANAFRRVSLAGIRTAAGRYRRFAILATPSNLLNQLSLQAPMLLVVALFGTSVGGQFALAQRMVALPATLIAGAVGQAYLGEAARRAQQAPEDLQGLFVRTTRSLALTALGPFLLAIVLAPVLFGIIFGQDWVEAGVFVAVRRPDVLPAVRHQPHHAHA